MATVDDRARYRPNPSVLTALKSPRLLTREVLAGLVVGLALIPEAIAFSIIAGVDPKVGLFSAFVMAVSIAIRRRPPRDDQRGDRSRGPRDRTGHARARHGLLHRDGDPRRCLPGAPRASSASRSSCGSSRAASWSGSSMRSRSSSSWPSCPHLIDVPWLVYPLVAGGLLIMSSAAEAHDGSPRPASLDHPCHRCRRRLAGCERADRGGQGRAAGSPCPNSSSRMSRSPGRHSSDHRSVTLWAMAVVGLLESLMTAKLVDEITDTHSHKTSESWAQGVANILTGFLGGMGGCAMIGQTMINVKVSGARTRILTFWPESSCSFSSSSWATSSRSSRWQHSLPMMIIVSVGDVRLAHDQSVDAQAHAEERRRSSCSSTVALRRERTQPRDRVWSWGDRCDGACRQSRLALRDRHPEVVPRPMAHDPQSPATPSTASSSSPPPTTSTRCSTTPTTPAASSSTCAPPTSGTPRPLPPSTRSRRSTPSTARLSNFEGSTMPAECSTAAAAASHRREADHVLHNDPIGSAQRRSPKKRRNRVTRFLPFCDHKFAVSWGFRCRSVEENLPFQPIPIGLRTTSASTMPIPIGSESAETKSSAFTAAQRRLPTGVSASAREWLRERQREAAVP